MTETDNTQPLKHALLERLMHYYHFIAERLAEKDTPAELSEPPPPTVVPPPADDESQPEETQSDESET